MNLDVSNECCCNNNSDAFDGVKVIMNEMCCMKILCSSIVAIRLTMKGLPATLEREMIHLFNENHRDRDSCVCGLEVEGGGGKNDVDDGIRVFRMRFVE